MTTQGPENVNQYIDYMLSVGQRAFSRKSAARQLCIPATTLSDQLRRALSAGSIIKLRRDFYAIVAPQYRQTGSPPPTEFLAPLMTHLGQPFYIGLLSAAELHGAAHYRPQIFQVVTDRPVREISLPRMRLRFYSNRLVEDVPVVERKFPSGYLKVSSPEVTAYDLLYYFKSVGGLGTVTGVLSELADSIDPRGLRELLHLGMKHAPLQRLGYLLDQLGRTDCSRMLAYEFRSSKPLFAPLLPGKPSKGMPRDNRWRLIINAKLDLDQ